jgi:chromosome segregation ATPase
MAERPEEERLTHIVPDVNASLGGQARYAPPAPRLWPLWCLMLLLAGALGGFGYLAWQEHISLKQDFRQLQGQLSNVHARFDGLDANRGGNVERLENALDALGEEQGQLVQRLNEQENQLADFRETLSGSDDSEAMIARLNAQAERQDNLQAAQEATRTSLDALESNGDDARAALEARLDVIEGDTTTLSDRLNEVAAKLSQTEQRQSAQEVVSASLMSSTRSLETDQDALTERLDELATGRDEAVTSREALIERLDDYRAQLTELRQSQLAISAQLESLETR